jgi:hypothetical protein
MRFKIFFMVDYDKLLDHFFDVKDDVTSGESLGIKIVNENEWIVTYTLNANDQGRKIKIFNNCRDQAASFFNANIKTVNEPTNSEIIKSIQCTFKINNP